MGHYPELTNSPIHSCESEIILIETLMQKVREFDPQVIVDFADEYKTCAYIANRYRVLTRCDRVPDGLPFSLARFVEINPRDAMYGNYTTGRIQIDLRRVFLRKGLNCDTFNLLGVLKVDQPKQSPCVMTYLDVNRDYVRGREGRLGLFLALVRDLTSMDNLERSYKVYKEACAFSKLTHTSVEDCVKRGQQLPVINTLRAECHNRYFINNDVLRKPTRHSTRSRPPSITELPQPQIMHELRGRCHRDLERVMNHHATSRNGKLFNSDVLIKGTKELQGGSVLLPCPGMYTNGDLPRSTPIGHDITTQVPESEWRGDNRVGLLDFKALYPSIIIAFGICFSSIVVRADMLNVPDVEYRNYCINPDETVVFAVMPDDGVLPEILKRMLQSRQQVKDTMKQYKRSDPKRYLAMDILQKCIKILCNSFYGVCGARTGVGQIAITELMYVITYIGRCLQKQALDILARLYDTACVYGDTDSVFALFEFATHVDLPGLCASSARRFGMPHLTWDWLRNYYLRGKLKWDIESAPRAEQINALSYVIGLHVCEVINATFPEGITLERESILTHLLLLPAKKHYCATLWDDGDPRVHQKVKITGMACKKRDYPSMVRSYLNKVTRLLVWEPNVLGEERARSTKIVAVIQDFIQRLLDRNFTLEEVRTSRQYRRPEDYKNDRQPHLQVVQQTKLLTGSVATPDRRIFYVLHKGSDTAYKRAVHISSARIQEIDTLQLLRCIEKPMISLMTFHPWVCDVRNMFKKASEAIVAQGDGFDSALSSFFSTTTRTGQRNKQSRKRIRGKHPYQKRSKIKSGGDVQSMYNKFF